MMVMMSATTAKDVLRNGCFGRRTFLERIRWETTVFPYGYLYNGCSENRMFLERMFWETVVLGTDVSRRDVIDKQYFWNRCFDRRMFQDAEERVFQERML